MQEEDDHKKVKIPPPPSLLNGNFNKIKRNFTSKGWRNVLKPKQKLVVRKSMLAPFSAVVFFV